MNYKSIPGRAFNHKSFVVPENVTVAYTHGADYCVNKECNVHYVNVNISQISHYRDKLKEKTDAVVQLDTKIWKYKDELVEAVEKTIKDNDFNPILD